MARQDFEPKRHLRLRAGYFDLLRSLIPPIGVAEVATTEKLLSRLDGRLDGGDSPQDAIRKLEDAGILIRTEDGAEEWEVPPEIQSDVRWLLGRQRARSVGELGGLIDDLEYTVGELDRSIADRLPDVATEAAHRAREIVGDIASYCAHNRESIVGQVMLLKTNEGARTVSSRYRKVAELHDRYIEPIRGMLEQGRFVAAADDLAASIRQARQVFEADPGLPDLLSRVELRLKSLIRQAREDFLVAAKEVLPLYNQYRKDTLLAENAASCLDLYHRAGPSAFDFARGLPIASFKVESLFSVSEVEAFLERIAQTVRRRSQRLCLRDIAPAARAEISEVDVRQRLQSRLPVADALKWLFEDYPEMAEDEVLGAFSELLADDQVAKKLYETSETTFTLNGMKYRYTPVEIVHVDA